MARGKPQRFLQQIVRAATSPLVFLGIAAVACAGHDPVTARPEPASLRTPTELPRANTAWHLEADGQAAPEQLSEADTVYPFHEAVPLLAKAPALRYANLSPAQCQAELRKRDLPVKRAWGSARGIATPLRLAGPIRGVNFRTAGLRSVYGMLDCRLALALDEFAEVLVQHNVVKVRVDNMYRPRARLPGKRHKKSQHAYGLAADVTVFVLADERELVVERDWLGVLGESPCGPESRVTEPAPEAILLRNLVCDVARRGIFNYMLTPSYNLAHRDHLHLDIMRDAKQIEVK